MFADHSPLIKTKAQRKALETFKRNPPEGNGLYVLIRFADARLISLKEYAQKEFR